MGTVRRLSPRPETPELGAAIEAFLATIANRNTAKAYAIALRALAAEHGADAPLTDLEGEAGADRLAAWFTARWGTAAAATFNARRDALGSARLVARPGLADRRPTAPHPPRPHPGPHQGPRPRPDRSRADPAEPGPARAHPVPDAV
ncbi:hypothetical protein [Nonomuraea sp. NPDC049028]|uniref:hypothetical protein n=1 Tax=Nonomuraea sp. NPDC049028 TaxID=3364348 RepID=UPI003722E98B